MPEERKMMNCSGKFLFPLILGFVLCILFISPASADSYVGGEKLETVESGTISGDLWFDSLYGLTGASGQPNSAEKSFNIPEFTEVKWARLYVAVYCGNMEENYQGQAAVAFDGGQGRMNLGTELLNVKYDFEEDGGTTPVYVNDHCNRVTSDYLMWYDVTDLIKTRNCVAEVMTKQVDSSFDGRVKLITLVVAYDDGDTDEVYYWINQGHDVHSYYIDNYGGYTGETDFDTRDLPSDFKIDSAKLGVVHLASENGDYEFNGNFLDTLPSTGSYSGFQVWDVTDSVYAEDDSGMTYTRKGDFFKIILAFLSIKQEGEDVGSVYVESNPKGAEIYIDDDYRGVVTDSLISGLPVDSYTVSIHKDSYHDPDPVDVDVVKDEKKTVSFELEPITGSIQVSSEPEGAKIIIDGQDTGEVTGVLIEDLIIGNHDVVVSLDGYYEQSMTIAIEEGETAEADFTLLSEGDLGDESAYGYTGKELEVHKKGSIEGGVLVLNSSRYSGLLDKGDSVDYFFDVDLPENATVGYARLYIYSTWSYDKVEREASRPVIDTSFDGKRLYIENFYSDRKGDGSYDYIIETTCYDVSEIIGDSGDYPLSVTNNGGINDAFAVYGASLVIVYSDPESPEISYWIAEGCDSLLASEEYDTDTESSTTTAEFSGTTSKVTGGLLYVISTAASGVEGDENRIVFNDFEAFNLLDGGSSDISTAYIDVTPYIKKSNNDLAIQSYVSGEKGDYMENRLAIFVVEEAGEDSFYDGYRNDLYDSESLYGDDASSGGETGGNSETYNLNLFDGRVSADHVFFESGNGTVELFINQGTGIKDSSGMPVDSIDIKEVSSDGSSLVYTIGPEDAVSDLPFMLEITASGLKKNEAPRIVWYSSEGGNPVSTGSVYDSGSGIVSCRVNNFGRYAVIYGPVGEVGSGTPDNSPSPDLLSGIFSFIAGIFGMGDSDQNNHDVSPPGASAQVQSNKSPINDTISSDPEVIEIDPTQSDFDIQICSNPSSARIFIDGEYTGKITPGTVTLRGGEHSLALELEDFRSYHNDLLLSENTTFYADLEPEGVGTMKEKKFDGFIEESGIEGIGGVHVTSYPDGATIYINGKNTELVTPNIFYGLKEGMNTIKIKKAATEYSENTKKVWVDPGSVTEVNFGQAVVSDNKADIDSIEYDGYYFTINGRLPEYKLPKVVETGSANSYITFHSDGKYISHNIRSYYDEELNDIVPRDYNFGKVFVESVPEGAHIYVDGYYTGYSTPYAIDGLSDGAHLIEVSRPGYIREGKEILLTPDEAEYDETVKIYLEDYLYGSLEVNSNPAGARIYLYGKDTGKITPFTFRYMDIGDIDIKVVGDETSETLEDIVIKPYEITTVDVDLD